MYKYDPRSKALRKMNPTSFSEQGFKERYDVQEWIDVQPEILGEKLLLIAKELEVPDGSRLDLLAVDQSGTLVVIELKRGLMDREAISQAIAYASYVSKFDVETIIKMRAGKDKVGDEEAKKQLEDHVDLIERVNEERPRIVLVASGFKPSVASSVFWLNDCGLDLVCIQMDVFEDDGNEVFVTANRKFPLPIAEDYTAAKERKYAERKKIASESRTYEDVPTMPEVELIARIQGSLSRTSDLTPRLRYFLDRLSKCEDRTLSRDELIQEMREKGILPNERSGTYFSNISQFLTKRTNGHLRQLVEFSSSGGSGAKKDEYKMRPEWRVAYKEAVDGLPSLAKQAEE